MAAAKITRDVAREADGLSASVSHVLCNARNAGPETHARVLDAAHRLAYRPKIMARYAMACYRRKPNLQARKTRLSATVRPPGPTDHFNPIPDSLDQY